jgi:hypothetical protein
MSQQMFDHQITRERQEREDNITLTWVAPPIPDFDHWQATRDGYEPGDAIGCGTTQNEAIKDLLDKEDMQ